MNAFSLQTFFLAVYNPGESTLVSQRKTFYLFSEINASEKAGDRA